MKLARIFVTFAVSGLMLLACANQMQPAQSALGSAQDAVKAASADASKYMPEHYQRLQAQLSALQTAFDQKNYVAVVNSAPSVISDANSLQQQAATRKTTAMAALTSQWNTISGSVPKMIESIKARLDELTRSKHVRKDIDVAAAQTDLSDASSLWNQAEASHSAGDVEAAISAAKNVQAKAEAAADALKLKLPAAA